MKNFFRKVGVITLGIVLFIVILTYVYYESIYHVLDYLLCP